MGGPRKNHPGGQRRIRRNKAGTDVSRQAQNRVVTRPGESVASVCEVFQVGPRPSCSESNRAESWRRSPVPSTLCPPALCLLPSALWTVFKAIQSNSKEFKGK